MTGTDREPATIWDPRLVWVTSGAIALIFLAAIESLAVTTVMPVISADLDGASLYALAFAGTLATSVIGMVATGAWADRSGPVAPLYASVAFFVAGLILSGAAGSMELLVVGRLIQGIGVGGQTVALYVVVARLYPPSLHGRVFAAFAAAWVVPSLVGPFLAGAVAEFLHWRWVFLGVAALCIAAFTMIAVRLRGIDVSAQDQRTLGGGAGRMVLAVVVAAAVLGLGLAGEFPAVTGWVAGACLAAIAVAIRPLLPRGAFTLRRGLPSVVVMRGLIAGTLFGAEVYVPYLFIERYDFSPVWAGLALTASALAWASGSWVQGRVGDAWGNRRIALIGVGLLTTATATAFVVATWGLAPVVLIVGWTLAGAGMGLMYPRLTVLTLAYSTPGDQGFNSSALSISDSVGSAATIAVMGLAFTALQGTGAAAFPSVFAIATVLALLSLLPGLRLGHGRDGI